MLFNEQHMYIFISEHGNLTVCKTVACPLICELNVRQIPLQHCCEDIWLMYIDFFKYFCFIWYLLLYLYLLKFTFDAFGKSKHCLGGHTKHFSHT